MAEKAINPVPKGMHTITPYLWFNGQCQDAIDFYCKAFGATLIGEVSLFPLGKGVMHAFLQLGTSHIMMSDSMPGSWERGPEGFCTASIWLYVEDCDGVYQHAIASGCEEVIAMMDAFWGDRMGSVKDPYGHVWSIASQKWLVSADEIEERMQEWNKT